MSIRSKLFATVALPVFAASLAFQPALADSLKAPFEVAQEGGEELSPEDLLLLKKRKKQRAAEEESQGQAEEQQREAEEQQRAAEEEQQRAEEKARRRAEQEQQRAAEEEQQRQAEEQQRAAEEEQQRQAEERQRAAEEEQQRQAEEQQRSAKEEQQRQAEEQQRAAEEEAQQAEEQQRALRKKRQAETQRAAEEEQQRQAEEQQRAAEEEQQRAAEEEQQRAVEEQQAEEQEPAPRKKRRAEQAEEPSAPTEDEQAAEPPAAPEDETTAEQPATEEPAEETGEAEQQAVPEGEEPATAEQLQGEQPEGAPAPEVVDERTVEERQKIAEDPATSDETVVLPVERGAAVLDSDKDADNFGGNRAREIRRQQREELRAQEEAVEPPTDDASAQAEMPAEIREAFPQKMEAALIEEGQRVEAVPTFAVPETTNIVNNTVINNTVINNTTVNNTTTNVTEVKVVEEVDNRVILEAGDRIFVRGDDRPRLRHDAQEAFYEELPRGRYRETIVRPDGYRVVTIYNRYGDVLQRTRIDRDDNEYVLIYAPEYEDRRRPAIVDVGYELPPMRLTIPVDEYIVDYADDPDRDYYEFLAEPPVERVERVYTIDEVRHSARLRDKVRRIDLDTITFATGSAEVSMSQAKTLRNVASAMEKILANDPGETFFIEGHTDAVGSDRSNLVLSDERAESVASLLTEVYGIPPENLVTQGYGERFLKIRTQEAEQENRRVTIRRVTPLVRPVAQR